MDINDYFKQIAISHIDIAHTEDKPAYFREFSSAKIIFGISDFISKMRYAKSTLLISQFNKDGNYSGNNSDSFSKVNTGAIYLIKRVKSNDIATAYNETYAIWQDIFTKLQKDDNEGVFLSEKININLKNPYIHALGMIADGYYGIAIFLNYNDLADGSCLPYNPEKWK